MKNIPRKSAVQYVPRMHKLEEFKRFGVFMALPVEERKHIFGFSTEKDFAAHFKVRPATLSEWKMREELWIVRDQHFYTFKKHTADVIAALAKRAIKTGDAFHAQTFMKLVEGWTERSGVDITSRGRKVSGFNVVIRHAQNSPTSNRNLSTAKE